MVFVSMDALIVFFIVAAIFGTLVYMSESKYVGRSLIAFIFFTVLIAIIYLYLGAPIVAAFQILIYSGAVVAFMLLALSMMREEVAESPKIDIIFVVKLIIAFAVLTVIMMGIYFYVPLVNLSAPSEEISQFLSGDRTYNVAFFMWGVRPIDVVILGVFTVILAAGIRHFYKEIMRRE